MPPVIAVVVTLAATYGWTAVIVGIVTLASVAYSAYMMATMEKPPGQSDVKDRLQTIRSSVQAHRIIYGEVMAGGVLVYAVSHGENNELISLVIALAGHECEAIDEVWFNDRISTDASFVKHIPAQEEEGYVASTDPYQYVITRPAVPAYDGSYISITKYLGDQVAADSYLQSIPAKPTTVIFSSPTSGLVDMTTSGTYTLSGSAEFTVKISSAGATDKFKWKKGSGAWSADISITGANQSLSDGISIKFAAITGHSQGQEWVVRAFDGSPWTADHKLLGITYVVVTLENDPVAFPTGLPNVKCLIRGNNQIYDPATDTTGYTNNWALCIRDYLTKPYGLNAPAGDINDTVAIAARNLCAESVTLADGTTQPRYTCNGSFTLDKTPTTIMNEMLLTAAGSIVWTQGQYKILPAAYVPVDPLFRGMDNGNYLSESDLRSELKVRPAPSMKDRFNAVVGTYVSTDTWQPIDFPKVKNDTYASEDGGEITKDLNFSYVTNPAQAQRVAKIMLEKSRQGIIVEFPAKWSAFPLAVMDTVPLRIAQLGWVDKLFTVRDWKLNPEGGVDLVLQEEAEAIYAWNSGEETTIDLAQNTILPDPREVLAPGNLQLNVRKYETNAGMSARVDLYITWEKRGTGTLRYEVQYSEQNSGLWLSAGAPTADLLMTVSQLAAGNYDVRVRAINVIGVVSDWTTGTVYVPETTDTVPNVTGLMLDGDPLATEFTGRDVPIKWNYVAPPGNNPVGGLVGRANSWFRYYMIRVYSGSGIELRTEPWIQESYTYKYDMNRQDSIKAGYSGAQRTLRFDVTVMASWGDESPVVASLTLTNPAPAALTNLAITGAVNLLSVGLPIPSDPDFAGFLVHASQTNNFTPAANNQINKGGPETVVTKIGATAGVWYIRAAAYDSFGTDTLNYSAQYSVTVDSLTVVPELLDAVQRVDFFVRDTILYFDVAVLKWDAGYIDRGDKTYTLSAGTLAAANASYIIATFTDGTPNTVALSKQAVGTGIPTLTDNQAIIALTSDYTTPQGNYLCFVRQANSVMFEGAMVRLATITDAHITGTLSANKITSLNGATTISGAGINLLNLGETATWSNVTGAGRPADNATAGKSLGLPFESWDLNGQTLVDVGSAGKVGTKVLRLIGHSGYYPNQGNFIPIDPAKTYRVRFWAKPSADCAGLLYFSLRQFTQADPAYPCASNGGRSPYKPAGTSRATHVSNYGDTWGEYNYLWSAADWQSGAKYVQPDFLDNYTGAVGSWDIQGFVFEEVTEVIAASTTALWSGVTGTGKPDDNATVGAIWGTNLGSIPARFGDAPSGAGLCITSTYMGYYNGSAWKTYMDNSGNFYLSGSGTHSLAWNGATLNIRGSLNADDITAGALLGRSYRTASSGKRIDINYTAAGEMQFYGDAGGGEELLANIGILQSGSDYYIGYFGSTTSGNSKIGLCGTSYSGTGVMGTSTEGTGVYAYSGNSFALYAVGEYGVVCGGNTSPMRLIASSSASAPTHTATKGSLWVTSDGILYINTSGSTTWGKVGAQ